MNLEVAGVSISTCWVQAGARTPFLDTFQVALKAGLESPANRPVISVSRRGYRCQFLSKERQSGGEGFW